LFFCLFVCLFFVVCVLLQSTHRNSTVVGEEDEIRSYISRCVGCSLCCR